MSDDLSLNLHAWMTSHTTSRISGAESRDSPRSSGRREDRPSVVWPWRRLQQTSDSRVTDCAESFDRNDVRPGRRFVLSPSPTAARFVVGARDRSPAVFNVSVTWWAIIRSNTLPRGLARRVGGRRPPTEISSAGRFSRQTVTFGTTWSRPIIRGIVSDYARLCGISVQALVGTMNSRVTSWIILKRFKDDWDRD